MKRQLKICGLRDAKNIQQVAAFRPDYMGFIFYKNSKRFVGDDFKISSDLPRAIKRVGVFVNENIHTIMELAKMHQLDFVQLHGHEPIEDCIVLKQNRISVIKTFAVDEDFDFSATVPYQLFVDFFLFDTKSEGFGGSGKIFDWSLLKNYNQQIPFFLSGGLSHENIADVVLLKGMNLHALDINSGVEFAPGVKDIAKIEAVIKLLTPKF